MERRTLLIKGVWTEELVIQQPIARAQTATEIVIVPGNPGTALFYVPFAHELHSLLRAQCGVRIITLAGFSPDCAELNAAAGAKTCFNLEEQTQFLIAYLEAVIAENQAGFAQDGKAASATKRAPRLVLVAHSIGCHLSIHAAARRPDLNIVHASLLFPFVRFDLSLPLHAAFRLLFVIHPLVRALLWLLKFLPITAKLALIRLFTGASERASERLRLAH